jgi:hypothetical protein
MGLYYAYCIKCNRDGSFSNVDRECGKCCGTGKDWRESSEMDWLKNFVKGKGVDGRDLEIFYEAYPPTTNLFGDSIRR